MLPFNYKRTGVSFSCKQWKGALKAFHAGLALPSPASKGTEGTQQAAPGKTRRTRIAFGARKKKKLHDTLSPLEKN